MTKPKIAIIEDDESLIKLMSGALEKQYDLSIATTDDNALDNIKSIKPKLIILDILLPGKNGFDFLKELKADPLTKNIPVLVLSNLGLDDEMRRGVKMGAADYLVKADSSIDKIIETINKILKNNK